MIMEKIFVTLLLSFFTIHIVQAQDKLVLQGSTPNWFIMHKVASGENLTTIAEKYKTSVAKIAAANNAKADAILKQNAAIKIPISKQAIALHPDGIPVYYIVKKGDNLYKVSLAYNKVSLDFLRNWNNIKKDIIREGQYLIVGYIGGKQSVESNPDHNITKVDAGKNGSIEIKGTMNPANPTNTKTDSSAKQPEENKTKPVIETKEPVTVAVNTVAGDGGFFASAYPGETQGLSKQFKTGDAGIFKTISGWEDKKYYVLMNEVTEGTIVQIVTPNNKTICAKVLGPLPNVKSEESLVLRMSNSAAAALGMTADKFIVTVHFYQ